MNPFSTRDESMKLDTDILAELVTARHVCLTQLCELGQRQIDGIMARDFTQLMKILAGKQRLLVTLDTIERRLDPFRGQAPESRHWNNAAKREQCAAMARACELLLGQVVEQEKQSERLLQESRDEAAAGLRSTNSAVQAINAYAESNHGSHSGLDLCTGGS